MTKAELLERVKADIELLRSGAGWLAAGTPDFNWIFGRDSLISAWQLLPYDPAIARGTLETLAFLQGKSFNWKREEEPGKIIHEFRTFNQTEIPFWEFPYYGSVDATPLFVIVARFYLTKTKNWDFIKEIWGNIEAAIRWCLFYGDTDGDFFIESDRKNPRGIINQSWKDSSTQCMKLEPPIAFCEIQGYAYRAYRDYLYLSERLGEEFRNPELFAQAKYAAEALQENFNRMFWLEEENFPTIALSGVRKSKVDQITSNPGQLLFTGLVREKPKRDLIAKRLFEKDLFTPYGIRTLSRQDPCFDPFSYHCGSIWLQDNWIIYQGLRGGYPTEARKLKEAMLKAALELGFAPELHTVIDGRIFPTEGVKKEAGYKDANRIQAWSAGAILNLLLEEDL